MIISVKEETQVIGHYVFRGEKKKTNSFQFCLAPIQLLRVVTMTPPSLPS